MGYPPQRKMTGVNGKPLVEKDLATRASGKWNFNGAEMERRCAAMGMTCSYFLFTSGEYDPLVIYVDEETDTIAFDVWAYAGFVPMEWITTKPLVTSETHLCWLEEDKAWDWHHALVRSVRKLELPTVEKKYLAWLNAKTPVPLEEEKEDDGGSGKYSRA